METEITKLFNPNQLIKISFYDKQKTKFVYYPEKVTKFRKKIVPESWVDIGWKAYSREEIEKNIQYEIGENNELFECAKIVYYFPDDFKITNYFKSIENFEQSKNKIKEKYKDFIKI